MASVCFLGCGNLGTAILVGYLKATSSRGAVSACVTSPSSVQRILSILESEVPMEVSTVSVTCETQEIERCIASSQVIILGCKPQVLPAVGAQFRALFTEAHTVVSLLAGVKLAKLFETVGVENIVRAMPNTPAMVGAGMTALCGQFGPFKKSILKIFESCGKVLEIDESKFDAVTAVSGSGPAYVYMFIEALTEGGVRMGLPYATSLELASQTVLGAATMVGGTQNPAVLKAQVMSPAGTTIAGVATLEDHGLRAAVMNAVKAAADRSAELGK
ncbi:hypothetical protein CANCADRAFT_124336 [Tortispora caseinolytica NRRL Y-17796]|uniref:Pyrroline-5-carboxylate reductase n=1 Tax=Tortispora caseinolytica NRRL Y-17796 TaxID=767744 RepID=A0A1E4T9U3_9ASCO|nr:hypothetical protein CANCADRAFT_124336 [Tortispora caseinolytica NRRL Y-17796]